MEQQQAIKSSPALIKLMIRWKFLMLMLIL